MRGEGDVPFSPFGRYEQNLLIRPAPPRLVRSLAVAGAKTPIYNTYGASTSS